MPNPPLRFGVPPAGVPAVPRTYPDLAGEDSIPWERQKNFDPGPTSLSPGPTPLDTVLSIRADQEANLDDWGPIICAKYLDALPRAARASSCNGRAALKMGRRHLHLLLASCAAGQLLVPSS